MEHLLNQMGSVEDIRCTLKHGACLYDIKRAIENELENQNRATVIKMLEVAERKEVKRISEFPLPWRGMIFKHVEYESVEEIIQGRIIDLRWADKPNAFLQLKIKPESGEESFWTIPVDAGNTTLQST